MCSTTSKKLTFHIEDCSPKLGEMSGLIILGVKLRIFVLIVARTCQIILKRVLNHYSNRGFPPFSPGRSPRKKSAADIGRLPDGCTCSSSSISPPPQPT